MRRKANSDFTPEWEQPYLQKPEIPDWKEAILGSNVEEAVDNEFNVLFEQTKRLTAADRDNVTDRADFLKKDDIKIANEIRSRIDRFLKDYNYKVLESSRTGAQIDCLTQLTSKGRNSKTIIAVFSFTIEKPRFLSANISAEKIEASANFACNNEFFPLTKRGFDIAFEKHGYKFAESTVITTLHQLENQYNADDIISGVENKQILPLTDQLFVCEASYLNQLQTFKKTAAVDSTYITERHAEKDSDSSARLQSIEKEEVVIEAKQEAQYRFYTENNLLDEIKREFGLAGDEAESLISQASSLVLEVPGGYITEDKFSKLVVSAGIITENKLSKVFEQTNQNHMTSKIQGEYRLDAEQEISNNSFILAAKSKINGKNTITAQEINKESKQTLVKVSTIRKIASYEIPVDYFFCFRNDGSLKGGHATIAGKNFDLEKLDFFYSTLEKECEKRAVLENRPEDFKPQAATTDRNNSYITDDSRTLESVVDTDRFPEVRAGLKDKITQAMDGNFLTKEDVQIFHQRIDEAKQISELTQIEKEFKVLTDLGDL